MGCSNKDVAGVLAFILVWTFTSEEKNWWNSGIDQGEK